MAQRFLYCISIYSYSITILNRLYSKYLMFHFLNDIEIAYFEIYLKIFDASLLLINKWKYSYGLVRQRCIYFHWLLPSSMYYNVYEFKRERQKYTVVVCLVNAVQDLNSRRTLVQSIPFIVNSKKCSLKTCIHYKSTIGAEKPVQYKRVFTITESTINGIDCITEKIGLNQKKSWKKSWKYRQSYCIK
jgi:hypothetical protein